MTFEETAKAMLSDDYRERMKAEFYQLKERIDRLDCLLTRWDKGELKFKPNTPYRILTAQLFSMLSYAAILEERCHIEGVDLVDYIADACEE